MKILNFELEEKLDQHFQIKFDGESDADSFEAQKQYFDPLNDLPVKLFKYTQWPLNDLPVKLFKYTQGEQRVNKIQFYEFRAIV